MKEVWCAEERVFVGIPDCDGCDDTGEILLPVVEWHGRVYIGHGPQPNGKLCRCHACTALGPAMKAWLEWGVSDGRIRALPAEAVAAIHAGELARAEDLRYCPLCPLGERQRQSYREQKERQRKDPRHAPPVILRIAQPERIDPESDEGEAVLAHYRTIRGEHGSHDRQAVRRQLRVFLRGLSFPDEAA